MDVKSAFGGNLKFYRKEKCFSQEQLSEKVNISVKHLSALERGLTFVSAELLEKLSATLEIPVYYFFLRGKDILFNKVLLNAIDSAVETRLTKAIEDIKSDIRQND